MQNMKHFLCYLRFSLMPFTPSVLIANWKGRLILVYLNAFYFWSVHLSKKKRLELLDPSWAKQTDFKLSLKKSGQIRKNNFISNIQSYQHSEKIYLKVSKYEDLKKIRIKTENNISYDIWEVNHLFCEKVWMKPLTYENLRRILETSDKK